MATVATAVRGFAHPEELAASRWRIIQLAKLKQEGKIIFLFYVHVFCFFLPCPFLLSSLPLYPLGALPYQGLYVLALRKLRGLTISGSLCLGLEETCKRCSTVQGSIALVVL